MAIIACLGWGSLVWDSRELPIQGNWLNDGPFIHVEFMRQSRGGRLTLVLTETERPVQSLWAVMDSAELETARQMLANREEILDKNVNIHIGSWSIGEASPPNVLGLPEWAQAHGIQHVIWTALPPKLGGKEKRSSEEEILGYLASLTGASLRDAEKYIRLAPIQIDTPYRRRIEAEFHWIPTMSLCKKIR